MNGTKVRLPYFDLLLREFALGDQVLEETFGRHVHWGFWENPAEADGSPADFACAAEALSRLLADAADIGDGMSVLDAGCGFGGTVESLNDRHRNMNLVGLNLDERQLERARARVSPTATNEVAFVQGDACALPFADGSFDAVLAVECIFHFPSRLAFFQEVHRVLRPGGRLALSDFLLPENEPFSATFERALLGPLLSLLFGPLRIVRASDYEDLAGSSGLRPCLNQHITTQSLPTYALLELLMEGKGLRGAIAAKMIRRMGEAQRAGRFLYEVLAFEKPRGA